jgi:hypothetical protein
MSCNPLARFVVCACFFDPSNRAFAPGYQAGMRASKLQACKWRVASVLRQLGHKSLFLLHLPGCIARKSGKNMPKEKGPR